MASGLFTLLLLRFARIQIFVEHILSHGQQPNLDDLSSSQLRAALAKREAAEEEMKAQLECVWGGGKRIKKEES